MPLHQVEGVRCCFASMISTEGLERNCPNTQSAWRESAYFMRTSLLNLVFTPHRESMKKSSVLGQEVLVLKGRAEG